MGESRQVTRLAFAILVLAPLGAAACDLLKHKEEADAGAAVVTATATPPTTAATTAAPQETATPLVPATATHGPTKVVKLVDGGTATIPATGFDAAAIQGVVAAFDAAALPPPTFPGFDAAAMPKGLPSSLPSGFPTALPGWPPPQSTAK